MANYGKNLNKKPQTPAAEKPAATAAETVKPAVVAAAAPVAEAKPAPAKVEKPAKAAKTEKTAKPAKTAKAEKPAKADKPAKKEAAPKEKKIDDLTAAYWTVFEKTDVSGVKELPLVVNVVVADYGTFYILLDGEKVKHIHPYVYEARQGDVETTYDEALKILAGGYDFVSALEKGKLGYKGDIKTALALKKIFKV